MRSMRLVLSLAVVSLMFAGVAQAQLNSAGAAPTMEGAPVLENPVIDQFADCTGGGPASQEFPDFGNARLQAADDFTITGSITVSQVIAIGSFSAAGPYDSVTVEFYDTTGPGGLPGALLCSETGLVGAAGPADPTLDLALAGDCTLAAGTYWISVLPVMPFNGGATGQWFQGSNNSTTGSEFAWQDPAGLTGNPCVTWGLGITDCGIGATFPDLCFGIGQAATTTTPTPAVGTFGVVVMLALFMGLSIYFMRRRQTA